MRRMKYRGAHLWRIAYANFISMDMRRTLCAAKHYVAQPLVHSPEFEGNGKTEVKMTRYAPGVLAAGHIIQFQEQLLITSGQSFLESSMQSSGR